jgi:hypothetical protein
MKNKLPSQANRILVRLQLPLPRETDGWVSMPVLSQCSGSYNVHSRIAELRERGHLIANRITYAKSGVRKSWYRLEG